MFCPACGKEMPDNSTACPECGKTQRPYLIWNIAAVAVAALMICGALIISNSKKKSDPSVVATVPTPSAIAAVEHVSTSPTSAPPVPVPEPEPEPAPPEPKPEPTYVERSRSLFAGQIVVGAKRVVQRCFDVTAAMRTPRVTGKFQASGGSGNDIQAVLAEQSELENFMNGHRANVGYATEKTTNGAVDVVIQNEGRYCFVFSNMFGTFNSKNVFAEIVFTYAEIE